MAPACGCASTNRTSGAAAGLVLLGLALGFSLVLGVGMAWWRGVELVETGAPQQWLQSLQERLTPEPPPEPPAPVELSATPEQLPAPVIPS